ncbi:MAG: MotA/TolQ/ExbB proton channel family protein [Planctomycetes bacterium]|nr:MotA/TolQ/ExbB proton channel family protein [Planctomycetota bacterium]
MNGLLRLVVENGGFTVVLIAAVSIAALTVAIERAWRLLPLQKRFQASLGEVTQALVRGEVEAGSTMVAQGANAMDRVIAAGLAVRHRGAELVRIVALDAAQREVAALERGLGILMVSAQVAPLLGLLGTVVGLIEAFQAAGAATTVTPALLSTGLYKALGTTVAGLWVAIPSYLAYGALSGVAGRLIASLEHGATVLPALLPAHTGTRSERRPS